MRDPAHRAQLACASSSTPGQQRRCDGRPSVRPGRPVPRRRPAGAGSISDRRAAAVGVAAGACAQVSPSVRTNSAAAPVTGSASSVGWHAAGMDDRTRPVADVADAAWAELLPRRVDLTGVDAVLDHPQREVVLALLAQDAAQQFDVVVVELAVSRRRPLRVDQTLALEEADLRDRDVGELLEQQPEHLTDRQVRHRSLDAHLLSHRCVRRTRGGTCRSAARRRGAACILSMRSWLT